MHGRISQLFLINALTFGLEVCLAAGTIYIPPMLLEAGVEEHFMTMVLGLGPVLGLIFVPLIGSSSDSLRSKYGRRRPFIWALCMGVLLGLLIIPQTSTLVTLFTTQESHWLEVPLLVLAICLMEFCGQACFTPLEALVSDLFPGEDESHKAFSVYSLMLSLGGCVGYLLPAVDWTTSDTVVYLGGQEAFIYVVLTFIFLGCLMGTTFISEEHTDRKTVGEVEVSRKPAKTKNCWNPCAGFHRVLFCRRTLSSVLSVFPRLYTLCSHMPKVIARLFVAELFSWMALMSFMMFYTDFIGEGLYDGVPSAEPGSPGRIRYDEGVRMASLGLFLQCVTSVVFSVVMEHMVLQFGARKLYLSSVVILAVSTAIMTVSRNITLVTIMAAATGYTFCTLQILPYTLTCLYHSNTQVYFSSDIRKHYLSKDDLRLIKSAGIQSLTKQKRNINGYHSDTPNMIPFQSNVATSKPLDLHVSVSMESQPTPLALRGMGTDIAILDSAYLLSQVVPSLFMGSIVQLFNSVTAYMACASLMSMVAVYFSTKIVFEKADLDTR
ncbi:solute carrier family 45 member 3-like isoform X1 [Xyrauchen texanus]|uniref:solute carrier family 45 member 3-like isoform X1 n=2 Tax=Xyrauchen texanus TaxID=154827 RepID=UPI002242925C|nr:solute carrier family 45 member 3-like isoform X1 [Xyrauchen texanus]XP_051957735.1 solute carrier family 45 member 3-like isoform X1 [Xyrauchen texanus]XP_051957738.1 solute carrier family 45 member 3-like isoform X1 [Xyrauchen texanus]XP_051957739.1 solute carrier family 45 member 3-like isoform X1 [Xyrauchen texanus]